MIRRSVEILVDHVPATPQHFAFVVRVGYSANAVLRHAIRTEIRLFTSELATDLARFPILRDWTTEDLQMLAGLLVNTMIATVGAIVDAPVAAPEAEDGDRGDRREAAPADHARRPAVALGAREPADGPAASQRAAIRSHRAMEPTAPTDPPPPLSWWGWGDPAKVPDLPPAVLSLLADGLGVTTPLARPDDPAAVPLAAPRLAAELTDRLAAVVGTEHADRRSRRPRAPHASVSSTPDLLRSGADDPLPAPDLVLRPGSHDEVAAVLELASRERVAVVPFGGGTSVVGGLSPEDPGFAGWIALDLERLNRLIDLDVESRARGDRARAARAAGRGAARRRRPHPRPLPAVVPVRVARRLRGGALERPGLGRLRPLRRAGDGAARRDAGRLAVPRPRAALRRRARICASCSSAPRGARRDHRS